MKMIQKRVGWSRSFTGSINASYSCWNFPYQRYWDS